MCAAIEPSQTSPNGWSQSAPKNWGPRTSQLSFLKFPQHGLNPPNGQEGGLARKGLYLTFRRGGANKTHQMPRQTRLPIRNLQREGASPGGRTTPEDLVRREISRKTRPPFCHINQESPAKKDDRPRSSGTRHHITFDRQGVNSSLKSPSSPKPCFIPRTKSCTKWTILGIPIKPYLDKPLNPAGAYRLCPSTVLLPEAASPENGIAVCAS